MQSFIKFLRGLSLCPLSLIPSPLLIGPPHVFQMRSWRWDYMVLRWLWRQGLPLVILSDPITETWLFWSPWRWPFLPSCWASGWQSRRKPTAGELELCAVSAQAGFGKGSSLPLILYLHLGRTILCRFQSMWPLLHHMTVDCVAFEVLIKSSILIIIPQYKKKIPEWLRRMPELSILWQNTEYQKKARQGGRMHSFISNLSWW